MKSSKAHITFEELPEAIKAKELADFFRVPLQTVQEEMDAGRLPVIRIGDEQRILKSKLIAHGTLSGREGKPVASDELPSKIEPEIGSFSRIPDFDHHWPDATSEHYQNAHEATASYLGQIIHIVIGSTERNVAGRDRKKIVVLLDDVNYCQFTSANDYESTGLVAAVIKPDGASQRHLSASEVIPAGYRSMHVSPYNQIVRGPHATRGLAVICDRNDLHTMARHALLRWASKHRSPAER
jgi:hypothetical protein